MSRKLLNSFLILLIAVGVFAQQTRPGDSSPDVERLRAHIKYLASDQLEGRRTGTAGASLAARYIAGEFARDGLRGENHTAENGGDETSAYLQPFPFIASVELGKNNAMTLTPAVETNGNARAASLDLRPRHCARS